jgi:uncharacterized protein YbjT (DUF2867 family)
MNGISVVGGSGLVGRRLLVELAGEGSVKAWVRKSTDLPGWVQAVVSGSIPDPDDGFWQCGALFVALGTTIAKAGTRERFEAVDHDLVLECARRARATGCSTIGVVSAAGADRDSRIFYSRVKGRMEDAVQALGFDRVAIARPSLLLGDRAEFRPGEWFSRVSLGPVRSLVPAAWRPVRDAEVARALVDAVRDPSWSGIRILTNAEMVG